MAKLYNLARMTVSGAPGTGTITLLAAVAGHLTFANAGVSNAEVVAYAIEDGSSSEVGIGTYSTTGPTLSRDTVTNSTAGGTTKITATSAAQVFISPRKEDIANLGEDGAFTGIMTFSGKIQFWNATGIWDNSGNEQLLFDKTASAVNFMRLTNGATSDNPRFTADGSDTDVGIDFLAKGAGWYIFYDTRIQYNSNIDGEVVALRLQNDSNGGSNQVDFQMGAGSPTVAEFQLSVRTGGGGNTDFYTSKGNLRLITAEAGKTILFNAGDTGADNIIMDDAKDLYLNNLLRRCTVAANDHTLASATGTEVTEMQFTNLQPGKYHISYWLIVQSSATGTGIGTGINFTGTATMAAIRREATTATSTATGVIDDVSNTGAGQHYEARAATAFSTSSPNMLNTGGFATANANCLVILEVALLVTASGDLELWHSSETAANTSIKAGSFAELRQAA